MPSELSASKRDPPSISRLLHKKVASSYAIEATVFADIFVMAAEPD